MLSTALGFVRLAILLVVGMFALVSLAAVVLYIPRSGSDAQLLACATVDSAVSTFSAPFLLLSLLVFFLVRRRWGFRPWRPAEGPTSGPESGAPAIKPSVTRGDWALWLAAVVLALSAILAIVGWLIGSRC